MKILHYISGISPTIGGIEIFILNIYEEFKKHGHEIEILTRYVDRRTKMFKMISEAGIKVHSLDVEHLSLKSIVRFKKSVKLFFNNHKDYDILHSHCIEDPCVIHYAKKSGVKKVGLHVHSYRKDNISLKKIIKGIVLHSNCKKGDFFLSCSSEVGESTYPLRYNNIRVVKNGIDSEKFEYDENTRNEYRKLLKLEDCFVICHVGRFNQIKNHWFLIDTFNVVLNGNLSSRLLLIGDGELKESIYKKCKKLKIEDKVFFLGDRSDVNKLLQAADVFVLPSFKEGFGIVTIEAQAAGLNTIVSKDSVSDSINITNLVEFISLDENEYKWANTILKYSEGYNRKKMSTIIKRAGYDNKNTVIDLIDIYNQS